MDEFNKMLCSTAEQQSIRNLSTDNSQTQGYSGCQINKDTDIIVLLSSHDMTTHDNQYQYGKCRQCVIVSNLSSPTIYSMHTELFLKETKFLKDYHFPQL